MTEYAMDESCVLKRLDAVAITKREVELVRPTGMISYSKCDQMYDCSGKGVQKCVLCREVVPFSEGPLSEVPLYSRTPKC